MRDWLIKRRDFDRLRQLRPWGVEPEPPYDPALLRHIGGDLFAVLAVWDLTEIERAVLAGSR